MRKILDCHIHYGSTHGKERMQALLKEAHIEKCALMCIPRHDIVPTIADALLLKGEDFNNVYVFGGIDRGFYLLEPDRLKENLCLYTESLLDMGCDGIKLLEGKPDIRRKVMIPDFDGDIWAPFWEKAEREQIPILFHVNDPEEYWDETKVSEYAKSEGWFYGKDAVNNEDQYEQVQNVLNRHPKLRILFAHFYFMSAQLDRIADILRTFSNVKIDLTPGIELYYNLSANVEQAKLFFEEFQDRICYGTDIGSRTLIAKKDTLLDLEESRARLEVTQTFLETKGSYVLKQDGKYLRGSEEMQMRGLGLPEVILNKIYGQNFMEFVGKPSRKVNYEKIIAECDREVKMIQKLQEKNLFCDVDISTIYEMKKQMEEKDCLNF